MCREEARLSAFYTRHIWHLDGQLLSTRMSATHDPNLLLIRGLLMSLLLNFLRGSSELGYVGFFWRISHLDRVG